MDDQLTITTEQHPRGMIVRLHGDATCTNSEALRRAIQPVVDAAPSRVVLDLSHLLFINSLGLGVLLEFRQQLIAAGGRLDLSGAHDDVIDVLRKTRLVELFPPYGTPEEAFNAA
jgi:anti-sigma B factor antagonist